METCWRQSWLTTSFATKMKTCLCSSGWRSGTRVKLPTRSPTPLSSRTTRSLRTGISSSGPRAQFPSTLTFTAVRYWKTATVRWATCRATRAGEHSVTSTVPPPDLNFPAQTCPFSRSFSPRTFFKQNSSFEFASEMPQLTAKQLFFFYNFLPKFSLILQHNFTSNHVNKYNKTQKVSYFTSFMP